MITMAEKGKLYLLVVLILAALAVVAQSQRQTLAQRIHYHSKEGFFPLWWSSAAYVWGFIKLGYIFAGLLALWFYRNWVYDSTPDYGSFPSYHYRNKGESRSQTDGYSLDHVIENFGSKYNQHSN